MTLQEQTLLKKEALWEVNEARQSVDVHKAKIIELKSKLNGIVEALNDFLGLSHNHRSPLSQKQTEELPSGADIWIAIQEFKKEEKRFQEACVQTSLLKINTNITPPRSHE